MERLEKFKIIVEINQMNNSLEVNINVLVENLTDDKNSSFWSSEYMTSVILMVKR
jgi:hypothetical protein